MSTYASRQSTLHDGNIITAALFNNEYNAILNAFAYASSGTTGHQHDGTAGGGGNISKIGDSDFLNKIVIESNEVKFFIEVGGAAVEQLNLVDGVLAPETNNDIDLGTSSKRFKTVYATTLDVSTAITNAQLAGSIANDKLANSTVSYGGISLALGASDATPAFDLSDATNYPTSSLSGTIATAQIANSNVTTAKIADSNVTTAKIADDAVTQAKIANSAVDSDQLASGAVIAGKLENSSVATANIQSNAVTTDKIPDDAITTAKIADGAVNTDRLGTQAVTGAKIASATITSANLGSDSVTTAKIADSAVTAAKLADTYLTSTLSADIDANEQNIVDVGKLFIGASPSLSAAFDVYVEGAKTSEEHDLVRIVNSNTGTTQDGRMISMIHGSNHRGSLGYTEVQYGSGSFFAGPGCGLLATTQFSTHIVQPCDEIGDFKDDAVDLGASSNRFDDVYATNGTIQTSDRNEKQDIAELSDAERRVAVAAKSLLRKFKWQSAVTEKGDDARTHFGIIAQDLQAAFTAEGLDAGDYAMFISTTWWEHEGETYTKDAPEGATEKTRLGVRYPELLAFIISAL